MAHSSSRLEKVSRLNGDSIVDVAAYISREAIYSEREDTVYDRTDKKDILFIKIYLPENAPPKFYDRYTLWNSANNAERRYDGRMGRTYRCALPNELPLDEHIKIVEKFVKTFLSLGMCVDAGIHEGKNIDDPSKNNPHVHFLLSDRPCNRTGFLKKDRSWNKNRTKEWNKQWELEVNRAYERNGLNIRISCESLEVQGIKREPTKYIGREAMEMENRGILTKPGNVNRDIVSRNEKLLEQERERDSSRKKSRGYELEH